jgi:hypothetical protein
VSLRRQLAKRRSQYDDTVNRPWLRSQRPVESYPTACREACRYDRQGL